MSASSEDFSAWTPPGGGSGGPPGPFDKFWLFLRLLGVAAAETFNWFVHVANYSLANPVGSDLFVIDVLGFPPFPGLEDITVGLLINGILALAAVATPVFLFSQLLERHNELFGDPKGFFRSGLARLVTALLVVLYAFVIATEFSALYLRVQAESAPSPIIDSFNPSRSFWPMLIMSVSILLINAGMGLASAHILRSVKAALKGE